MIVLEVLILSLNQYDSVMASVSDSTANTALLALLYYITTSVIAISTGSSVLVAITRIRYNAMLVSVPKYRVIRRGHCSRYFNT